MILSFRICTCWSLFSWLQVMYGSMNSMNCERSSSRFSRARLLKISRLVITHYRLLSTLSICESSMRMLAHLNSTLLRIMRQSASK